jgi:putative aldouronate transport system permease protein
MNFFKSLPVELEESAKIDGANDIHILFSIILPLSLPILATFALYYGVERWNEWYNGMLFIKSTAKLPLQTVLRNIVQDASVLNADVPDSAKADVFADGVKMASVMVTMLPIMCLYPFLQRFFVTGLTAGAVKS